MLLESAGMWNCVRFTICRGLVWQVLLCLAGLGLGLGVSAAPDPYSIRRPGPGYNVQTLLIRAEQGDKRAAFLLGSRYAAGRETTRDDSEALRWFTQSAEAGLAEAQYNLGIMYAQGRGVPRDIQQAANWYTRAAQQGLAMAQFNLGTLYSTGAGVPRDEAKAADWLERAANQGLGQAQFNLGILYEFGRGVRLNAAKALYWYRRAEEESAYAPAVARRRRLEDMLNVPQATPAGSASTAATPESGAGSGTGAEVSTDTGAGINTSMDAGTQTAPATASQASETQAAVEPAIATNTDTAPEVAESASATAVSDSAWLAGLDAERYTLQLASYVDREAAEQFMRRLKISETSGIYASTKQGKRWYSVIYGDYASYQKARAASRSLPASFRGIKPWVRKVSLIKKEME